jgi:hypothetical protein
MKKQLEEFKSQVQYRTPSGSTMRQSFPSYPNTVNPGNVQRYSLMPMKPISDEKGSAYSSLGSTMTPIIRNLSNDKANYHSYLTPSMRHDHRNSVSDQSFPYMTYYPEYNLDHHKENIIRSEKLRQWYGDH